MSKKILGIDPGTDETGYAIINEKYEVIEADKVSNDLILNSIINNTFDNIAIESIQSYGMQMGDSTIRTCFMIGRIIQTCINVGVKYTLIPRPEYGKSIIGTNKVNDALIRTALENRFGSYDKGKEEKKLKSGVVKQAFVADGPLYKLSGASDKRSAFAVAAYWLDQYGDNNV